MDKPKEILDPVEYKNYRIMRVLLMIVLIWSSLVFLGGLSFLFDEKPLIYPEFAYFIAIIGLLTGAGAFAALYGGPPFARLLYVTLAIYIFAFPVGTILSLAIINGLNRYFDSRAYIRQALASKT